MPKTWREGPLKAPKAKSVVLGFIDAFDPDIFVQFSKHVPTYIKDLRIRIIKPDEIWETLKGRKALSPKYGIGILELFNDLFRKHFEYKAKYPVKISIPVLPKQFTLFWASLLGEIPSKLMPLIKEHYLEPLEIVHEKFTPDKISNLLKANVIFPRRLTQHGLDRYRRSGIGRDAYCFFMDAAKTDDIIDYWNLRALGRNVMPIPKQFLSNDQLQATIIGFLKAHRVHWAHNETVCDKASIVRSRNSTMDELEAYAKTLRIKPKANDPSKDGFFLLQHWYPRVWDEWARDKDRADPDDFYGDEDSIELTEFDDLKISFHPLLPKFADKYAYHGEPRCANEISFLLYGSNEYLAEVFPRSGGENLIRAISSLGSFRDYWRIGRNGLVKLVKDNSSEYWEIPEAQKVLFAWLKDQGWEANLSAPGLLAKQIYRSLDGHIFTLANEKLLGLLEHMNGGTVQSSGQPVKKNIVRQSRELPIAEIRNRLQDSSMRSDLCDYLISKGIFRVGLRIQCPYCIRESWFPVDQIEKTFACPLCLNVFPSIGNIENATWCYKTTGPFSVSNYADGAYATLLALDFFNDRRLVTMRISPALSFTANARGKDEIEADFALFWEDSIYGERRNGLVFGECKTYGRFNRKDFIRMRLLAKSYPGAVLVFSTLRRTLTGVEVKELTRIAKMGRKYWKNERPINPVLILTGNEIFSFYGPPHCWEDAGLKSKFDHLAGLLDICDATQQIYLNLPSWRSEWHEKWEKQRQMQLARKRSPK
jgi:hypothetical protein